LASDSPAPVATAVLGDEYDDAVRARLMEVLRRMGAIAMGEARWSLAGSQQVEELDVDIDGRALRVEAETYVGLSIRGALDLVDGIQREMAAGSPTAAL